MPRSEPTGRRWIPAALGVAMLVVVIAAALTANTGAVPAASSCAYGNCPSTNSSSNTLLPWELALGVLIAIAVLLALVLLVRRRRGGGGATPPVTPMAEWSGGGSAGGGGPDLETDAFAAAPVAASAGVAAAAPAAYLETEEDVATPPPAVPAPASPPPGASGGGAESDIDSLMQELDKISSEILKRGTPKTDKGGSGQNAEEDAGEGDGGSS